VCQLRGQPFTELEYENDHSLDSGCWYKFIRDGRWRDYEHVLFVGEGTLLAHPRVLPALVAFAGRRQLHFIASGHEKRRVPRPVMARSHARGQDPTPMDAFHDRMIAATFEILCRDPEFRAVFDRWGSDFNVETEHHVPDVAAGTGTGRRLRSRIQRRWGSAYTHPDVTWVGRLIRNGPPAIDRWISRAEMRGDRNEDPANGALAYAAGGYAVRPSASARDVDSEMGVTFHRVDEPEWFGCATNHLMSRSLLERFDERLKQYGLYDVLDVPFAGTALEMVWGFLPEWLGVEKWFTNGFHRVRKNFATYQREDYPPEIASYINRYHRGRLVVGWDKDYLTLTAWRPELGDLRERLPAVYFEGSTHT
jgi:hypothetical protein